ncbi:lipid A biosynthesis lauroyl acyltransferase [Mixta theicola]|uniref:Lipid A biosynthesis acyltransferase n=1 Tax=Mixta theicola TaxID=1458355 RepID=A0A2K1QEF5_9GAMM|nr:Kdo(2)-lipid IV(A) acyltransferase [Mixta theicola]PNS13414.1 lipid A biosynthesis lauroyl acyltransferase [Mixta theicola]GLR09725.1 lipid A biosynthesis lauroyltransferase [Mixta theicola]
MTQLPQFSRDLLHPRYWLLWLGIGLLYLVVLLPYPVLYHLGCGLGRLSMRFMKRRAAIAQRNIELCFPQMPPAERDALLKRNFESVGMGFLETGIAWFWPDWRVRKWFTGIGDEHIQQAKREQKGILLIGMHFLSLELGARMFGMLNPGIGVYRPNDNPLIDWLQIWGRMRSNKSMIDRRDLKGMIRALKAGEIIWYAPDHDYGPKSSVFVPFFAVPDAASTKGSYMLVRTARPAVIPFLPRRLPHGKGYELIVLPNVEDVPTDNEEATAKRMNQIVEEAVLMAPEQYMWLHRRFKTRPPGKEKLY